MSHGAKKRIQFISYPGILPLRERYFYVCIECWLPKPKVTMQPGFEGLWEGQLSGISLNLILQEFPTSLNNKQQFINVRCKRNNGILAQNQVINENAYICDISRELIRTIEGIVNFLHVFFKSPFLFVGIVYFSQGIFSLK